MLHFTHCHFLLQYYELFSLILCHLLCLSDVTVLVHTSFLWVCRHIKVWKKSFSNAQGLTATTQSPTWLTPWFLLSELQQIINSSSSSGAALFQAEVTIGFHWISRDGVGGLKSSIIIKEWNMFLSHSWISWAHTTTVVNQQKRLQNPGLSGWGAILLQSNPHTHTHSHTNMVYPITKRESIKN